MKIEKFDIYEHFEYTEDGLIKGDDIYTKIMNGDEVKDGKKRLLQNINGDRYWVSQEKDEIPYLGNQNSYNFNNSYIFK